MNVKQLALAVAMSLQASAAQAEVARDMREPLFELQRNFWDDPAPIKAAMCSRRAGKSTTLVPWVLEGAIIEPDSVNPYISITRLHAKRNFWNLAKRSAAATGLPHDINESELTITFHERGLFFLGGADKISELEKYRASKTKRAAVDECQRFKSDDLEYLVDEVIEPALLDADGQLALGGTPGKVKIGYWYKLTRELAPGEPPDVDIPVHRWTVRQNPHIADVDAKLERIRTRRGWTEQTPSYVREYRGLWCDDPESLVYPFSIERNGIEALPTRNSHGRAIDVRRWRHVVAVDPAGKGITGIAVLAAHPDVVGTFVLESRSIPELLIDGLVKICRELKTRYPNAVFVMDTGGLGSTHAQEFTRKFAFAVKPAKKTERRSAVRWTHEQVLAGRIKYINGECNDAVRGEMLVIGWNDDHDDHEDDVPDHCCDCVLYGERELHSYALTEREPDIPVDTPAYFQRQIDEDIARRLAAAEGGDGREPWDR